MKKNWKAFWQNYRNIAIKSKDDLLYQVGKTIDGKVISEEQFDLDVKEIVDRLELNKKDIVLDLSRRLGKSIKANYPDIKVIYTRTKDEFIPLHKRADIANKNKADLFILIHVTGTEKSSVLGTETYVLGKPRSEDNLELSKTENDVKRLEDD